jgi:hypothetical protein
MAASRISRYSPLPSDDAVMVAEPLSPVSKEGPGESRVNCVYCRVQKHKLGLMNRDHSLTVRILAAFVVLLSINVCIASLSYIQHAGSSAPEGDRLRSSCSYGTFRMCSYHVF